MISIIGLGNAASAIAEKFTTAPQYDVSLMNDKIKRSSKRKFRLKSYENPEEYEKNIPDTTKFFADIHDHVQFIVMGSSFSSNYSLGILEQIKNKKIDLIYIKPDIDLLTGVPRLLENAAFGVLQEYTRSGLLNSMMIISNVELEKTLGDVPIKTYFETLNNSIFSTIHYLNYFNHAEPEIGQVAKPSPLNRIKTVGFLDIKNLEEKWLFTLDMERDLCYYMCINEKKLAEDGTLHKRIVTSLKEKPRNAFRNISYAIYETAQEQDFGFCVAHTNAIQNNS